MGSHVEGRREADAEEEEEDDEEGADEPPREKGREGTKTDGRLKGRELTREEEEYDDDAADNEGCDNGFERGSKHSVGLPRRSSTAALPLPTLLLSAKRLVDANVPGAAVAPVDTGCFPAPVVRNFLLVGYRSSLIWSSVSPMIRPPLNVSLTELLLTVYMRCLSLAL